MVRVTYSKKPAPVLPSSHNTNHLALLFQQPHLWNRRHQEFLRVKVHRDVPSGMIVNLPNLPRDGDKEFESLAEQFTQPSKEDLSTHPWRDPVYQGNSFTRIFERLGEMMALAELTEPDTEPENEGSPTYESYSTRYYRLSRLNVKDLVDVVESSIQLSTSFHMPPEDIKFHVQSCKMRGTLRCEGSIVRLSDTRAGATFPLATFATVREDRPKGSITYEIPHILVQAIIAFQRNPDLNKFRGHMIRQEGIYFEISSALVSRAYIQSVQQGRHPTEDIALFRSGSYDLREPEERREALRCLIGMMRYLDDAWFDEQ